MNLLRRLVPATLAARLFWGVAAASLLTAVVIWSWLYSRFYNTLDREASLRMRQIATALLADAGQIQPESERGSLRRNLLAQVWQLEHSSGLMQNLYWLDMSGERPVFIASFSREPVGEGADQFPATALLPPSPEDVEDLVYDHVNDLDRGSLVFPDPYSYGAERRFKVVLCPLLDADGLLESVIGIEADMQYLRLADEFKKILGEGIALAVLISLVVSLLLADNVAAKIGVLGRNIAILASGRQPELLHLSIRELDDLYQAFVCMASDLERQRATVRQVFVRKLEELSFTGGAIAHEIRNPLSAIEMHFGLLKRQLFASPEKNDASAPVQEIEQQLLQLRRLLTSFLNYSRRVQPQFARVAVADFLTKIIEQRRLILGDFKFINKTNPSLHGVFDPLMLQQVFDNLVNNSFRAAAGAPLVIEVEATLVNRTLRMKIADDGPGVPVELQSQLFVPFSTGNADGSGFGLAISRKLIEAHGGEIVYQNDSPVGAVFIIEVPQNENSGS